MILFIKLILWIAIVIGTLAVRSQAAQAKSNTQTGSQAQSRPNIVMFYIDDWAWNGSPVAMDDDMKNSLMPVLQMPNIQKLANTGMKFGNAYGAPQCAPARVCVQTGQSA
ncbi:MAG: sulfatase-like hydrolase/transferase, partial [Candidatus Latescibacteria bacterium]|nr:sulfatase-like hydrolase/transferase [Candidatus Latescibacterota bacterium]